MSEIYLPTRYYAHFGADYTLDVPAEGFGGWQKASLPLSTEHTALCVMHAWKNADRDKYPGMWSAVEYLPRAQEIYDTRMPRLLSAFRGAGIPVIHIENGGYEHKYEAYSRTLDLTGETAGKLRRDRLPPPESDGVSDTLRAFRFDRVHPGTENAADITAACTERDVDDCVRPVGDELMVTDSDRLQAVCALYGVNHLIYVGFSLNYCLLMSPGGMMQMSERGFLCSTVRECTTAVENDFTARDEWGKRIGLWHTALFYGFVYDQEDLEGALGGLNSNKVTE